MSETNFNEASSDETLAAVAVPVERCVIRRFRLLKDGEVLRDGDMSLDEDAETWHPVNSTWWGMAFNRAILLPVKRAL